MIALVWSVSGKKVFFASLFFLSSLFYLSLMPFAVIILLGFWTWSLGIFTFSFSLFLGIRHRFAV